MKKIISFCIISALMLSACSKTTTESMIVSTTPTNESSAVVSEETTETTMPVEDREDFILTNNWVFQDNSILMFSDNDTFTYYQSRDNLEDNYYTGTYEFYTGQAAYDYIGSLPLEDSHLTAENLESMASQNNMDDLICLTLNYTTLVIDGETIEGDPTTNILMGSCLDGITMNLFNLTLGSDNSCIIESEADNYESVSIRPLNDLEVNERVSDVYVPAAEGLTEEEINDPSALMMAYDVDNSIYQLVTMEAIGEGNYNTLIVENLEFFTTYANENDLDMSTVDLGTYGNDEYVFNIYMVDMEIGNTEGTDISRQYLAFFEDDNILYCINLNTIGSFEVGNRADSEDLENMFFAVLDGTTHGV